MNHKRKKRPFTHSYSIHMSIKSSNSKRNKNKTKDVKKKDDRILFFFFGQCPQLAFYGVLSYFISHCSSNIHVYKWFWTRLRTIMVRARNAYAIHGLIIIYACVAYCLLLIQHEIRVNDLDFRWANGRANERVSGQLKLRFTQALVSQCIPISNDNFA